MPTDERKDEVTGEAYSFNVKYKRHIDVQFLTVTERMKILLLSVF